MSGENTGPVKQEVEKVRHHYNLHVWADWISMHFAPQLNPPPRQLEPKAPTL